MSGFETQTADARRLFSALRTRTTPSHRFAGRPFAVANVNAARPRETSAANASKRATASAWSSPTHLRGTGPERRQFAPCPLGHGAPSLRSSREEPPGSDGLAAALERE